MDSSSSLFANDVATSRRFAPSSTATTTSTLPRSPASSIRSPRGSLLSPPPPGSSASSTGTSALGSSFDHRLSWSAVAQGAGMGQANRQGALGGNLNGNGAAGVTDQPQSRPRLGERAGSFQKDKDASPPASATTVATTAAPAAPATSTPMSSLGLWNGPAPGLANGISSTSPPTAPAADAPTPVEETGGEARRRQGSGGGHPSRSPSTLWMGDLESWMDEAYVRRCLYIMGWSSSSPDPADGPSSQLPDLDEESAEAERRKEVGVKMVRGASPSSGYCFLTFGTPERAEEVWRKASNMPPTLMPGSERTFKLNWATGLPGVQPRWDSEFSVFVGDLGREVTEGELVSLFTPLFPSTKAAKIMTDPSTGLSRGYGFVRFGEETDMHRVLALGRASAGGASGLSLRGRTIRISEASGGSGSASSSAATTNTDGDQPPSSASSGGPRRAPSTAPFDRSDASSPPAGYSAGRPNLPPLAVPIATSHYFPGAAPSPTLISPFGMAPAAGAPGSHHHHPHAAPAGAFYAPLALSPTAGGFAVGPAAQVAALAAATSNPATDPNNTTVFVGGLPACISEETLKTFFHHFGEITYVKIPPNKGCGFVQFVRRADAEMAIAKMHDFPIHGKSRIRLSWGRSQGDKQVEHVRKLAAALGVPFDAVWRMVQGQDNSTIKQIASAVGSATSANAAAAAAAAARGREEQQQLAVAAAQVQAQAQAAALAAAQTQAQNQGQLGGRDLTSPRPSSSLDPLGGDFFPRSQPALASLDQQQQQQHQQQQANGSVPPGSTGAGAGPYSRVSPSHFAPFSNNATPTSAPAPSLPLSPPPSATSSSYQSSAVAGAFSSGSAFAPSAAAGAANNYVLSPPASSTGPSPYERLDFSQGGLLGRHHSASSNAFHHHLPPQHQHHVPNSAPPEVQSFKGFTPAAAQPPPSSRAFGPGGGGPRTAWERTSAGYDGGFGGVGGGGAGEDWDAFGGEFASKLSFASPPGRHAFQQQHVQPGQQQLGRSGLPHPGTLKNGGAGGEEGNGGAPGGGGREAFSPNSWAASWLESSGVKA